MEGQKLLQRQKRNQTAKASRCRWVGSSVKHSFGVHYQIIYFIISPDNLRNSSFDSSVVFLLTFLSFFFACSGFPLSPRDNIIFFDI